MDLREQHAGGGHNTAPVFGCPICIQMRDYWTCGCSNLRLGSVNSCTKCGRKSPAYERRRRIARAKSTSTRDQSRMSAAIWPRKRLTLPNVATARVDVAPNSSANGASAA